MKNNLNKVTSNNHAKSQMYELPFDITPRSDIRTNGLFIYFCSEKEIGVNSCHVSFHANTFHIKYQDQVKLKWPTTSDKFMITKKMANLKTLTPFFSIFIDKELKNFIATDRDMLQFNHPDFKYHVLHIIKSEYEIDFENATLTAKNIIGFKRGTFNNDFEVKLFSKVKIDNYYWYVLQTKAIDIEVDRIEVNDFIDNNGNIYYEKLDRSFGILIIENHKKYHN